MIDLKSSTANGRARAMLVFAGLSVMLLVALVAIALYSFRQFSIRGAEERARTAAEIVRVSLTEAMANGTIDRRAQLLARVAQIQGLLEVHVVRGPNVERQFGPGSASEQSADAIDRQVVGSGKPVYLVDESGTAMLRATIPYIAERSSQPDCLQCHQVAAGDVLGVITIKISLAETRAQALAWVVVLVAIMGSFGFAALYLLRRQYQPIADVAESVEKVVSQAAGGDFRARLMVVGEGEAKQIAEGVNRLMVALDEGVGTINSKVEQLMQYDLPRSSNMLLSTLEMVEGLVDASRFKQAIEEDETKEDVYGRLSRVIQNNFDLDSYTIYEVTPGKNMMRPVIVDGMPDGEVAWCDQAILTRADACRARRTGHLVNSVDEPAICSMFSHEAAASGHVHVCLPMIQSGHVGCVVQLVAQAETSALVRALVPFLSVYLREAAPVLEAKRLTDTLRESNLRDAMTGLHNRRFVEESVESLVAQCQRRKITMSVLMLDLDYFKMVNDTYGHDAGDTVLKALAKVFVDKVRASDYVIRYGGEEFLIILLETDMEGAMQVAEKIRAAVAEMKVQVAGAVLQKTISIGVADFPGQAGTFWQTVKFADVALYHAKETGRNRVVQFTSELWEKNQDY